ncbi:hypothetical protein [Blastococcus sp. PRF04-17]|uniref:hypothetical protein n=1 Tax=Blastococcus sp. PRF04-17 TaxID=2933797 RepID=UPI001FF33925|nr:hypothetical protein [Blastococcus sp. PRF04-17]UOY03722.1 hypothetical protein MVA48_10485 [Blastococcus sp. PRF04-17]
MRVNQEPNGPGQEVAAPVPWEAAVAVADAWLPPNAGSLESRRLQAAARYLIQAVTWEIWNGELRPPTHDEVRRILAEELRPPGNMLRKMTASLNPFVADAARAALNARCWAAVHGSKNLVVAQAVMSLDAGSGTTAGPSQEPFRDAARPPDSVRSET